VIYLYQFPSMWGLPNASPFCMKVEMYLRLAHIPYVVKSVSNPSRSPKGKFPFIKDDSHVVADSGFIIDYLKAKYGDVLDKHLTPLQQSQAVMLQRMLEEHLYWTVLYSRWMEPQGWEIIKRDFFAGAPRLLRSYIQNKVRNDFKKALYYQGVGRHTRDEIYELGKKDIAALATMLGTQSFIFGFKPTSIDATAYAFIANILQTPIASPLREFANQFSELHVYCDRMKNYQHENICL
jgi:glutathione S-transferase